MFTTIGLVMAAIGQLFIIFFGSRYFGSAVPGFGYMLMNGFRRGFGAAVDDGQFLCFFIPVGAFYPFNVCCIFNPFFAHGAVAFYFKGFGFYIALSERKRGSSQENDY